MPILVKVDVHDFTLVGSQGHLVVAQTDLFSVNCTLDVPQLPSRYGKTSAIVVSNTYFQVWKAGILRSFIININNQGPSLVPWETPAVTRPHSDKQSVAVGPSGSLRPSW